jgi:predicted Zn-dependent protease with MMP-like domain
MDRNKFESIIADVLDNIFSKYQDQIENLSIEIDETEILIAKEATKNSPQEITLALYHGVPLINRAAGRPLYPDRITFYKKAMESVCRNDEELEETLTKVVKHEIGHYFGLDEDRLDELGY